MFQTQSLLDNGYTLKSNFINQTNHTNLDGIGEDTRNYNNLYKLIDYLFIPSLWEGGPMSVIEAYSKGIPIISSNVGWVSDFEIEHMFDPNNEIQLSEILKKIENKILQRVKKVENLSYKNSGEEIIKIVKNIKKI
jgi:glycosyltransferase involved in cell wall biosynthesis